MTRWSGRFRGCLLAAVALTAALHAEPAKAWWHGHHHHCGWRVFGGYGFSNYSCSTAIYGSGWGWGVYGPRVFSYGFTPGYAFQCYPYSYNLGCYPYGYGFCLPASYAPVYGPAGVWPFFGFASTTPAVGNAPRAAAAAIAASSPSTPVKSPVRASNAETRLRAAKLVAIGDGHLKAAVGERSRLAKAMDAYRRAASVAQDQADTHLRQAIVLEAMGRTEAADKAIERAVAIDARLGDDAAAAQAAQRRLPPDPVFGDRTANTPTTLASRTTGLLERIFRDPAGPVGAAMPAAENWIAARWTARLGDPAARLASR